MSDTGKKWTKGPWKVVHNHWSVSSVESNTEYDYPVAECHIHHEIYELEEVDDKSQEHYEAIKEANANLIAAAPELYDALEEILYHSTEFFEEGECDEFYQVLAKARGETL